MRMLIPNWSPAEDIQTCQSASGEHDSCQHQLRHLAWSIATLSPEQSPLVGPQIDVALSASVMLSSNFNRYPPPSGTAAPFPVMTRIAVEQFGRTCHSRLHVIDVPQWRLIMWCKGFNPPSTCWTRAKKSVLDCALQGSHISKCRPTLT